MKTETAGAGASREKEIAQEVARIREDIPYRGNYREQMAALLSVMFFKFGERVGANRLAALMAENGRSPSTSTAQDEINKFWDHIRENSAVKLTRSDLPPFLLDLFSTAAGTLWEKSLEQAEATFIAHRQEVDANLSALQKQAEQVREQLALARAGAEQALRQLQLANEDREGLARELADESGSRRAAEHNLAAQAERMSQAEQARAEEAARTHKILEELRQGLKLANEEQRRLMTIGDEFKQQANRDRALRLKAEANQEQLVGEIQRLQLTVTQLSSEKGVFEGRLAAQTEQLLSLQAQSAKDAATRAAPGARPKSSQRARVKLR